MKGWLVRSLQRRFDQVAAASGVAFAIALPDGAQMPFGEDPPRFTLRIERWRAVRRFVLHGHIGLLDSYFNGDVDVDGDLRWLLRIGMAGGISKPRPPVVLRNHWHEFRHNNRDWARAKANARFHYALGESFYRYWLDDPLMMYTCGYWSEGTRTLEEAQRNKVEHVCRKIQLMPGENVVDIGCGFGGFMLHAAEVHGAHVTGVNTTTEQVESVARRIGEFGLEAKLHVVDTDFRDAFAQFDKVVSIGVLEHAGRDSVAEVVAAHAKFLRPGGLGVLHFIGHVGPMPTEYFIRQHVFPGGWIPALAEVIVAMEDSGLEVVDIENLRRHYVLTLNAWAERFDKHWPEIHALDPKRFDERFRRIWRTYLIGCAEMFGVPTSRTHLFQVTFSKGNITPVSYPMSRAFLYERAMERSEEAAWNLA
ncbi:MAG TPA: cyclopropane-fatty-acyl-phospholipid synthase family protein [Burkholderiaceae bacterium]|nr:cyclopropane-fatty-acyl-phospholipid synthase family protein [Burkholderiaceae bacterium]